MKRRHDTVAVIVLLAGLALACARLTVGCADALGPEAAGASYAAQQSNCVAVNETKAAIDACRAKVRAEWGIDSGKEVGW